MSKEATRHNDFFAKIMGNSAIARDFFKAYLPEPIRALLDFDSLRLERCNTSIIRDSLRGCEIADLLFQAKLAGVFSYLLLHGEHQSKPDRLMPVRVVNYSTGALLDYSHAHPHEPLPPIISLVYYHGKKRPYPYGMEVGDLFPTPPLPAELKPYILKPILIDVGSYSDGVIATHGAMAPIDLLFKHIFDKHTVKTVVPLFKALSQATSEVQHFGIQYLIGRVDIDRDVFVETAFRYLDKEGIMTVADQIREEGREQGREQGIKQGERKKAYALLSRLLQLKFQQLPKAYLEKMAKADADTLSLWGERVLDAKTLQDVFADNEEIEKSIVS